MLYHISIQKTKKKYFQTSPVKALRNGDLLTRFVRLVDDHGPPVKVALFGKEAEGSYEVGDVIKITDVYPYNKGQSLSTKKQAKVEVGLKIFVLCKSLLKKCTNLIYVYFI